MEKYKLKIKIFYDSNSLERCIKPRVIPKDMPLPGLTALDKGVEYFAIKLLEEISTLVKTTKFQEYLQNRERHRIDKCRDYSVQRQNISIFNF